MVKQILLRKMLLVVLLLCSMFASAADFDDGRLQYSIISAADSTVSCDGFSADNMSYDVVTIPSNVSFNGMTYKVVKIAKGAFKNCASMVSLTIPASVIEIEYQSFNGCTALKTLILEDGEKYLKMGVNEYRSESYGKGLFRDCPLQKLYMGRNVSYSSYSDYDSQWGFSPFAFCPITDLKIGPKVAFIPRQCFHGTALKEVTLPPNVKGIGDIAFMYCDSLKEVNLPNTLESIGGWAFYGCPFTEFTIPDSVKTIGASAFRACTNLRKITIPASVEMIGNGGNGFYTGDTFYQCSSLQEIRIEDSDKPLEWCNHQEELWYVKTAYIGRDIELSWGTINHRGTLSGSESLFFNLKSVTLSDNVTSIIPYMFKNCGIKSITLPKNVKSIGGYAFDGSSLESLVIPSSVKSIGDYAFTSYSSRLQWLEFEANTPPSASYVYRYSDVPLVAYVPQGSIDLYKENKKLDACLALIEKGCAKETLNKALTTSADYVKTNAAAVRHASEYYLNEFNKKYAIAKAMADTCTTELAYAKAYAMIKKPFDNLYASTEKAKAGNAPLYAKLLEAYNKVMAITSDSLQIGDYAKGDGITTYYDVRGDVEGYERNLTDANRSTTLRLKPSTTDEESYVEFYTIVKASNYGTNFTSTQPFVIEYSRPNIKSPSPDSLQVYVSFSYYESEEKVGTFPCLYNYEDGLTGVLRLPKKEGYLHFNRIKIVPIGKNGAEWSEMHIYYRDNKLFHLDKDYSEVIQNAKSEIDSLWATQNTLYKLDDLLSDLNNEYSNDSYYDVDFSKGSYQTYYSNYGTEADDLPKGLQGAVVINGQLKYCIGDVQPNYDYNDPYNPSYTESETSLPANTAVLLKSGRGNKFCIYERRYSSPTNSQVEGNMLHVCQEGGSTRLSEDGGNYFYYRFYPSSQLDNQGRAGFYWAAENGGAFQAEPGEVYLALPAGWHYWYEEPLLEDIYYSKIVTGVATITKDESNVGNTPTAIYTLDGSKMINQSFNQLPAGIYIVNGKKVIKK